MNYKLGKLFSFLVYHLSSLKLSVICLFLYCIIVFWGTLAQVDLGIFYTQKLYFQSIFITKSVFGFNVPIFPGGGFIGFVLLVNLLSATIFKLKWYFKNVGLICVHFGLIILLAGAGLSSCITTESVMAIKEGESSYYSEDRRLVELAVIDVTDSSSDYIVSIPGDLLSKKSIISHVDLPFQINVQSFYENSQLLTVDEGGNPRVSNGIGTSLTVKQIPVFVKDDLRDNTTVIFELIEQSKSLGTWLVALDLNGAQEIDVNGRKYMFMLRPYRYYNPYYITLNEFQHDLYAGTTIPKNYASLVSLNDPYNNEFRDVKIYMNHPLRYRGKTFFQMSFAENDTLSILQVVDNPIWQVPYFSCLIITLGLSIHFFIHLFRFINRKKI